MMKLRLIHIRVNKKLGIYQVCGFKYAGTTYRVAYEIIENKVIPVLLCGTHENFYEQLKKLI